jgi:hypothetical protein
MENDEKPSTFCDDQRKFIMTFVSTTAEAIQATQGAGGLMIMSVAIGTKLWEEMDRFRGCDVPKFETRAEHIECFMGTLKGSGAIGSYAFEEKDGRLVVRIKDCFFAPASDRQIEAGLEHPLCPIGGLIVAGLHKTAHILAALEGVEHNPESEVSTLTFKLYS